MTSTQQRVTRALIIGALAVGAWAATEVAEHTDAHADTKPAEVVEHAGGALDRLPAVELPAQASEPSTEPEQAPAPPAEPAPVPTPPDAPASENTTEPAPVEPPPAVDDVPPLAEPLPPIAVDTPPSTGEPAPTTKPATPTPPLSALLDPTRAATTTSSPPAAQPEPIPQPDPLPWEVDPTQPDPLPADCDTPPQNAAHVANNLVQQLIDSLTGDDHTATGQRCNHNSPHPVTPDAVGQQPPNGKPPADIATGAATLTLNRLTHARARSQLPGSRHVAIEPGPA